MDQYLQLLGASLAPGEEELNLRSKSAPWTQVMEFDYRLPTEAFKSSVDHQLGNYALQLFWNLTGGDTMGQLDSAIQQPIKEVPFV